MLGGRRFAFPSLSPTFSATSPNAVPHSLTYLLRGSPCYMRRQAQQSAQSACSPVAWSSLTRPVLTMPGNVRVLQDARPCHTGSVYYLLARKAMAAGSSREPSAADPTVVPALALAQLTRPLICTSPLPKFGFSPAVRWREPRLSLTPRRTAVRLLPRGDPEPRNSFLAVTPVLPLPSGTHYTVSGSLSRHGRYVGWRVERARRGHSMARRGRWPHALHSRGHHPSQAFFLNSHVIGCLEFGKRSFVQRISPLLRNDGIIYFRILLQFRRYSLAISFDRRVYNSFFILAYCPIGLGSSLQDVTCVWCRM